jgi:hypothetical protein
MCALTVSSRRTQVIWVSAFFSPTIYFLLLIAGDQSGLPAPPETLVATLFFLMPVVALFVCETIVWRSGLTPRNKVLWMLFTLLGIAVQFGLILAFVVACVVTATGLAHT